MRKFKRTTIPSLVTKLPAFSPKDKVEVGAGAGIHGAPVSLIYRRHYTLFKYFVPFTGAGLTKHHFEFGGALTSLHLDVGGVWMQRNWYLLSSVGVNIPSDFSSDDNLLSIEVLTLGRRF